jgi:RNA polymerase sigma-70 factor (ECF subfamily)
METTTSPSQEREQRFRAIYDAVYVDLLRFVRRRVHPTHAEDVVGDVMLVAWRRLEDVPADPSAARAWLFGVARKTLLSTRRREDRHDAMAVRLAGERWGPADRASEQETITLSVLDGLSGPEAAAVLGISPTAFRLRLSRARRTLRRRLDLTTAGGPVPDPTAPERSLR